MEKTSSQISNNDGENIEFWFTSDCLEKLENIFGDKSINLTLFQKLLVKVLPEQISTDRSSISNLFQVCDSNKDGVVSFRDLLNHLGQEIEQQTTLHTAEQKFNLIFPGTVLPSRVHKTLPTSVREIEDTHLLFSPDGFISFWTTAMCLRKTRSLNTPELEKARPDGKWYTDVCVTKHYGKAIVSTGDKEIQFYELPNLESCCQLIKMPSLTCALCCKKTGEDELTIVCGDWHGCLTIIVLRDTTAVFRKWKVCPRILGIASVTFEQAFDDGDIRLARWKVHNERIIQVRYTSVLSQVISCSTDGEYSIAIGCCLPRQGTIYQRAPDGTFPSLRRPADDEVTYKVRHGIRAVDIWEENCLCAAVGVDPVIRLWNVMSRGKMLATLKGTFPMFQIAFYPPFEILVSLSVRRNIRFWDMKDFNCLLNIPSRVTNIPGHSLQFMKACLISKMLLIQTSDVLLAFSFHKANMDNEILSTKTHVGPVVGVACNELLDVWVTCSLNSVKVWDVKTGKRTRHFTVFEDTDTSDDLSFSALNEWLKLMKDDVVAGGGLEAYIQGNSRNMVIKRKYYPDTRTPGKITCLCVDRYGSKIVTGHESGVLKEMNIHDGLLLRDLCTGSWVKSAVYSNNISAVEIKDKKVIAVGSNKVVDVYGAVDTKEFEPISVWTAINGHDDEITCIDSTERNLIGTGSFDGLVILWNYISGRAEARLKPPLFPTDDDKNDSQKVTDLSFYNVPTTERKTEEVYLLTAGPGNGIHMWEVHWMQRIVYYRGMTRPWSSNDRYFTRVICSDKAKVVICADNIGELYVFCMKKVKSMKRVLYNTRGVGYNDHLLEVFKKKIKKRSLGAGFTYDGMPSLLHKWSAHSSSICSLNHSDNTEQIISGDGLGNVRIWTTKGEYVGMLGQNKEWNIDDPETFIHPGVPEELKYDLKRQHEEEREKLRGKSHVLMKPERESAEEARDSVELMSSSEIGKIAALYPSYVMNLPPGVERRKYDIVHKDKFGTELSMGRTYFHRKPDDYC